MLGISRPGWDEYFLSFAALASRRSTCLRRKVGAIAVKDYRILATGYNGAPSGLMHCAHAGGCLREELKVPSGQNHELCRGVHAEQNVIIQAAVHGVCLEGATVYCTHTPCTICAKMLINCKIGMLVCLQTYGDERALEMLREADVLTSVVPYTIEELLSDE